MAIQFQVFLFLWSLVKYCLLFATGCTGENLCQNGGTCSPVLVDEKRNVQDFYCLCPLSWTGQFCTIPNIVSLQGNGSLVFEKSTLQLPLKLTFDFKTTIGDGNLLSITRYLEATEVKQNLLTVSLLRGNIRGTFGSQSFAFPYFVTNDNWTWLDIYLDQNGGVLLKTAQSTCDFPFCHFNFSVQGRISNDFENLSPKYRLAFGASVENEENGFIGCLRNITVDEDLVINSPWTLAKNHKIGCRSQSLCKEPQNQCNQNGVCIDRWLRTSCKCNPGFDGPTCSQRLPKYTLGYVNEAFKSITFKPLPNFKYPVDFTVAFRPSPTSENQATQLMMITFNSSIVSQVGFLWKLSNNQLYINDKSQGIEITPGHQHLISVSIVDDTRNGGIIVSAKLNSTKVLTQNLPEGSSALEAIILGSLVERLRKRETNGKGGYFILDMVEVDGTRMSLGSSVISGFSIDTMNAFANEYINPVCETERPCRNNGICSNSISEGFTCQCLKGFKGKRCNEVEMCDHIVCPEETECKVNGTRSYCHSAISLDGFNEFVEFKALSQFDQIQYPVKIAMKFRTKQKNGIFMLLLAKNIGKYFVMQFVDETLMVSFNTRGSFTSLHKIQLLRSFDGNWADFEMQTRRSPTSGIQLKITISQNGAFIVNGLIPFTENYPFYAATGFSLFLGGVSPQVGIDMRHALFTRQNMGMCIADITYSDIPLIAVMPKTLTSRLQQFDFNNLADGFQQLMSISENAKFSYGCPPSSPCTSSRDLATCQNDGQCEAIWMDSYQCKCPPGFSGKFCEQLVRACDSMPCENNGQCKDLVGGGFTCRCPFGWNGER